MVIADLKTPGVYREEVFLRPKAELPTGIPAFVGFTDAIDDSETPVNIPILLRRKEEFAVRLRSRLESYLSDAVNGFFDNGGEQCYLVRADLTGDPEDALIQAIKALASVDDVDLISVPDVMTIRSEDGQLDEEKIVRIQVQLLNHANEQGDRLALFDVLPGKNTGQVLDQVKSITAGQKEPVNGALYHPWIKTTGNRFVPPSGHIAGIIARTDRNVGVFKAPANAVVEDVFDLEFTIDNQIQAELNQAGVNCLRAFPGRGIRIWGARTLSSDPNWRYINIRRLFLTVGRWIDRNMIWATFEPNRAQLWVRIERELTTYLTQLWQAGALKGVTPEQAFFVRSNSESNPQEVRDSGQVVTEIGLAPTTPAEFIVVRIIQHEGSTAII